MKPCDWCNINMFIAALSENMFISKEKHFYSQNYATFKDSKHVKIHPHFHLGRIIFNEICFTLPT